MISTKKFGITCLILLIGLLSSGCGPSPEEQASTAAALTAAAATSTPSPTSTPAPTFTPTPTPTPTPVPYALSLIIVGEEDAPIIGASVVLAESDAMQNTDDVGQAFWSDLPGETVNLSVSAQGYFPQEITDTITRGVNQLTINLDRDPHGILPSEACGPNETLLYLEDFQDGEAQGWQGIEFRVQGWDLIQHPDSAGNKVIQNPSETDTQVQLDDFTFGDAVWRVHIMPQGKHGDIQFSWHHNPEEWGEYNVHFYEWGVMIGRPGVTLLDIERYIKKDVWQLLEISTYNDTLEVWLDGIIVLKYTDPKPIPGGQIGIGLMPSEFEGSMVYFDNLIVCELTEPFVPLPTP